MEIFLERLLLELLFIAIQIAAMRLYQWLRSRSRPGLAPAEVLAAA